MLRLFRRAVYIHFQITRVRQVYLTVLFVEPLLTAITIFMIYRGSAVLYQQAFVVLGVGLAGIWAANVSSTIGDINRERINGTLVPIVGSPTSLLSVMLAKVVMNNVLALIPLLLPILYGRLFWGILLVFDWPFFIVALLFLLASLASFALSLSIFCFMSRLVPIAQNILQYPLFLLTGVIFPIEALPGVLHPVAWLLPLTWGTKALQMTITGFSFPLFCQYLVMMACLGGVYLLLAILLFRMIERRVRQQATLDLY